MDSAELDNTSRLPDLTALMLSVRDGVTVRNFRPDDTLEIYEMVKRNAARLHFMEWMTPEYSLETAREFVDRSAMNAASGESLSLGLYRDQKLIGSIGFVHFEMKARRTEIGYWIDAECEGMGFALAATRTLVQFAFSDLQMNRIEIRCDAENVRSAAIPRALGFKQEAHLREHEMRDGRLRDYLTFGLLRSDQIQERGGDLTAK